MDRLLMQFRFKGSRNYIHGPDIYDAIVAKLENFYGPVGAVRIAIHQFARTQCELVVANANAVIDKPEHFNAEVTATTASGKVVGYLVETFQEITQRYEFDESLIERLCMTSGQRITIHGDSGYGSAEVAVSLTKQLHNRLLPMDNMRWIVTRFDMMRAFRPEDAVHITVELVQQIGLKLTKSTVYAGDELIGHIYFSAVPK